MLSQLLYASLLLSVTFKTSESVCVVKPNTAIVTALFPLHSGSDCSTVEIRGLQQAAALQATVNSLNPDVKKESNIVINLKIQDTCSNEDGAVKAALKSMVDSDQTCLHPPLFMGFIGPEDKHVLEAVHQVTKLFNATHVVPYNLEAPVDTSNEAILAVTSKQAEVQAESIITVLRQLEWTTFSIAIDDSPANQILAKNILEQLHGDMSLCVINNIARITNAASINEALTGSTGYGILVLADSAKVAIDILQINKALAVPMVIFLNKIGLQSWQVPAFNSTLIILQDTTSEPIDGVADAINASMYATYLKQQDQLFKETHCKTDSDASGCTQTAAKDPFQGSLDASLLPLSYATRLMASSLLTAHKAKCRMAGSEAPAPGLCSKLSRTSQTEWRNSLQRSTAVAKQIQNGNLPTRIHFQMKVTEAVDIFVRNQISLGVEKIGQITGGNNVKLQNGYSFPSSTANSRIVKDTVCPSDGSLLAIPTILVPSAKATPAVMLEPAEGHGERDFYEVVTLLCGAGLGIVLFIVIMIYIVYSNFKVKTEKESAGGSPSFQRKPSRIARWRRGSGQSSRASIRTID